VRRWTLFALGGLVFAAGCHRDMWDQPKITTLQESDFFADKSGARTPVAGTVARGHLNEDELLHDGTESGATATRFPYEITKEILEKGRGRYDIFCLPCHGQSGDGLGMIVQRGFKQPRPLSDPAVMSRPVGYYFGILRFGFDKMNGITDPALADKVHPPIGKAMSVDEKWATIAYIRALQRSQTATAADIPPEEIQRLNAPEQEGGGGDH
jgi:hypothetical protein